jgi:hypothetical protein
LQRDIPRIDIEVTGPRRANAVVEIYAADKKTVVDIVVLDANGKHTWIAPSDALYYFALKASPGGPPARLFALNG